MCISPLQGLIWSTPDVIGLDDASIGWCTTFLIGWCTGNCFKETFQDLGFSFLIQGHVGNILLVPSSNDDAEDGLGIIKLSDSHLCPDCCSIYGRCGPEIARTTHTGANTSTVSVKHTSKRKHKHSETHLKSSLQSITFHTTHRSTNTEGSSHHTSKTKHKTHKLCY